MEEFPSAHPNITFFIGPFLESDINPFSRDTGLFWSLHSSACPRPWFLKCGLKSPRDPEKLLGNMISSNTVYTA